MCMCEGKDVEVLCNDELHGLIEDQERTRRITAAKSQRSLVAVSTSGDFDEDDDDSNTGSGKAAENYSFSAFPAMKVKGYTDPVVFHHVTPASHRTTAIATNQPIEDWGER